MDIRKIEEVDLKLLNMRNAVLFNKVGNVKQESIVDSLGGLEIPESVLKVINSKIEDDYALIKKALNLLSEYKAMGLTDFNSELSKLLDIKYSVWVGGTEVLDYYVDREKAEQKAKQYTDKGYDDVIIFSYIRHKYPASLKQGS